MPPVDDTIAAVATAPGRGGIGVIRISGPAADTICRQICGRLPAPRHARLARFLDAQGDTIDEGLCLRFPAPASYTGEDVVELHAHGGNVVLNELLARAVSAGARRADPGEFTQRAFLNGKLDLVQAEAVADLIDAGSRQAARAARRSLSGEFSVRVDSMAQSLTALRVQVEAGLDFPDEDVDADAPRALAQRVETVLATLEDCLTAARAGRKLSDAVTVVIAGAPNAGKSSLLNALLGERRAIVTEIPGTTRDVIVEPATIGGVELLMCDTAGLREAADAIEREGIALTRERLDQADVILAVVDASASPEVVETARDELLGALPPGVPVVWAMNKIDVADLAPGHRDGCVYVSATRGDALPGLEAALGAAASAGVPEGEFSARARHVEGLERACEHASVARDLLQQAQADELVAEELRLAQQALEALTGRVTSDDLLGEIFASFCIGK